MNETPTRGQMIYAKYVEACKVIEDKSRLLMEERQCTYAQERARDKRKHIQTMQKIRKLMKKHDDLWEECKRELKEAGYYRLQNKE